MTTNTLDPALEFLAHRSDDYERDEPHFTAHNEVADTVAASGMMIALGKLRLLINDLSLPHVKLDPLTVYCNKTGQPIGARHTDAIFDAIKIHGEDAFFNDAMSAHGLNTHPAWINTNGISLDRLMEAQPVAYAAYCLGTICDKFTNKPAHYDRNAIAKHHYARARAYTVMMQDTAFNTYDAALMQTPVMDLNFKLVELMTFAPDTVRYIVARLGDKAKSADQLALLATQGKLSQIITDAIETAMQQFTSFGAAVQEKNRRQKFEDTPTSPADAARGPSHIRQQDRSKSRVKNRQKINKIMQDFGEFGFGQLLNDGERAMRANMDNDWRNVAKAQAKPRAITIDTDMLAMLDMRHVDARDTEEFDEYEVEVRVISRAEADDKTGHSIISPSDVPASTEPQIDAFDVLQTAAPVTGVSDVLRGLVAVRPERADSIIQSSIISPAIAKPANPLLALVQSNRVKK